MKLNNSIFLAFGLFILTFSTAIFSQGNAETQMTLNLKDFDIECRYQRNMERAWQPPYYVLKLDIGTDIEGTTSVSYTVARSHGSLSTWYTSPQYTVSDQKVREIYEPLVQDYFAFSSKRLASHATTRTKALSVFNHIHSLSTQTFEGGRRASWAISSCRISRRGQ